MKVLCLAAAALVAAASVSTAFAQKRAITPEDYYAVKAVSDPHVSPDGKFVVFVITTASQKTNKKTGQLWLASTDGSSQPRQLTNGPQSSTHPRWSPDGQTIAFLSGHSASSDGPAKPQIHLLRLDGGEPRALTNLKNAVSAFSWSPNGAMFVCVSSLGAMDDVETAGDAADKTDTKHYTHATYKFDGKGFSDNRHEHLWTIDTASGQARQITRGDEWADTEPEWSPDSTRIAFMSDRSGKAFEGSRQADVWIVAATGGEPLKISRHESGTWNSIGYTPMHQSPRWSEDGQQIAFLGQQEEEGSNGIYIAPSNGAAPARLAVKDVDSLTTTFAWRANAFYWISNHHGTQQVFRADASGKAVQLTSGDRFMGNLDLAEKAPVAVFTANDFQHPNEVFTADLEFKNEHRLSHANDALLSEIELPPVKRVPYKAADGLALDGFVVKPYGWQAGKKYPMILELHGGPSSMFGFAWNLMFQQLAARGWAIFYPNFRGTSGYGPAFLRAVDKEWGGKVFTDVMSGVDAALAQNPWIDSSRLGVMGASFGGYMTNWTISHSTRFKAAVAMASISDLVSIEGTRDMAYSHAHDFGGDLFQNFDLYWKYSPLHYAQNVETPTLILHGEADHRVPIEQPEQWFRALRHFDVPAEIVMFPHEGHGGLISGEPRHIVETIRWASYWFDRYLNQNMAAVAPDAVRKRNPGAVSASAPEAN